ncbi:MAG: regulatory protein RecX [Bacteroidetes bacterium]|nr:regulatory protein RecX [Bacteroidota bacterium]
MRITKIEPQKKNPARRNIYLDGEFAVGVGAETLIRFGLRTGDEVGADKLKALQQTEELSSARNVALRFLSYRQRSRKEIRDKLREKEFGEEEINQALDALERTGLVNDAAFARMFAHDHLALRPTGSILLKRKLLMLGVDKATIEEALADVMQNVDQNENAQQAGEKFLRKALAISPAQEKHRLRSKLTQFLVRRGFGWDAIGSAVAALLTDERLKELKQ